MLNKIVSLSLPNELLMLGRNIAQLVPSAFLALKFDLAFNSLTRGTAPRGHRDCSCPIEYERTNSHVQFDTSPERNQKVVVVVVVD